MLDALRYKLSALTTPALARAAALGAAALFALLLGTQLAGIVQTINYRSPAIATPAAVRQHNPVQLRSITNAQLFGITQSAGQQKLPETSLQLVLRGAFTASNPTLASAIIEHADKQSRSYKINSPVYGQTTLHAVYTDRVVLATNGQLETLYFPAPEQTLTETSAAASSTASASQASADSGALTMEQRQVLIRERLQQLRERARNKSRE